MPEPGEVTYSEYQNTHLKDENQIIAIGITDYICLPGTHTAGIQ